LGGAVFQVDPAKRAIMNHTRVGDRNQIRLASDGITARRHDQEPPGRVAACRLGPAAAASR
jgi:hypothetical protein